MLYLLVARNRTNPDALAARDRLRAMQFETVRQWAAQGIMRLGGAILDSAGAPLGSMALLDFQSRDELDEWLAKHPYRISGIWDEVEAWPVQLAPVFAEQEKRDVPPPLL
jgi:uncharacterized protein YciI